MKDFLVKNMETGAPELFADGDLITGECHHQNTYLMLMCEPGAFKEFPDAGVGVASYLEDDNTEALLRDIRLQFAADGMPVKEVKIKDGKLMIEN